MKYQTKSAWILLGLFLTWQVGFLVHVAFVAHTISPDGRAVHADVKAKHRDRDTGGTPCDGGNSHRCGCKWIDLITSASTLASDGSPPAVTTDVIADEARPTEQVFHPTGREIFRISPANSPPAAA